MNIDYSSLQADVAAWQKDYVQHIRETLGNDFATAIEFDLNADPSLALAWYMEDLRLGLKEPDISKAA